MEFLFRWRPIIKGPLVKKLGVTEPAFLSSGSEFPGPRWPGPERSLRLETSATCRPRKPRPLPSSSRWRVLMDPAFDLCKGSPSSAPGFRGPRLLDAPPPNNILKDTQHPLCSGSGPCADTERSQTSAFPSHALQVPGTSFSKGLCP